jgi:acetyl esterase/lipase
VTIVPTASNIIYGMHCGLALLLDVYKPVRSNGLGIVYIAGSGWHSSSGYDAPSLKDSPQVAMYTTPLLEAGYTVFAVNHRQASVFKYPAAVRDAQRAVRYVRFSAGRFEIDPARMGACGGSTGAHLVSMLGVLDGAGDVTDPDRVNHESARVQCVVARAAPLDLMPSADGMQSAAVVDFLGMRLPRAAPEGTPEQRLYRDASPLFQVSANSAPFLLMHGDADPVVPFSNSERMEASLRAAAVPVKLLRVRGGMHGPEFPGAVDPPDYLAEMVRWFDAYLRG